MTSPSPNRQPLTIVEHILLGTAVVVGLTGIILGGTIHWVLLGVALVLIGIEAVIRRRRLAQTPPPSDTRRRR